MTESYNSNNTQTYPIESLKLKDKNTAELYSLLADASHEWSPEQQGQFASAYDLILTAHADDRHKDRPYTEHVLRVANRLALYMDIKDPNIIIAGMLHDIVEDHAREMIDGSLLSNDFLSLLYIEDIGVIDPKQLQMLALYQIERHFSLEAATIVAAVTNEPPAEAPVSYEDKLQSYAEKVTCAIQSPEAWLVKFADWCDNGLGINFDILGQGEKREHFKRKYGMILPILKKRFEQEDLQTMLSDKAKRYIVAQFQKGERRLPVAA